MTEFLSTRFLSSSGLESAAIAAPSLLVRVYPVQGLEPPLELSADAQLVGRGEACWLQLDDDSVSRRHAMIEATEEGHVVSDLGSTNGTFVNEQRVTRPRQLAAGDRVRFGNQIFKYLGTDGIEAQYHEVVFKLMTTDGLTGVYNKRYFAESFERELALSQRAGTPLCVMMLDLDKFKSINDAYGHLAGDAVLVEFARRAKSVARSGELLARYGGEEFALLLTRTALEEAACAGERIRAIAAESPVEFEATTIPLSVSIGIACCDGHANDDPQSLLAEADRQLYVAKNSGRNQVRYRQGD